MGLVSESCYLKPSRKVFFYPGDVTTHRQLTSVYMELRSLQTMPQSRWEVAKAEREHCVGGTRVQQWEASGGTAPVTGRRRQKSAGRRADHGSLTTCRQALGGRDIGEENRESAGTDLKTREWQVNRNPQVTSWSSSFY